MNELIKNDIVIMAKEMIIFKLGDKLKESTKIVC